MAASGAWYGNTGSFIIDRFGERVSASTANCEYVLLMMLDDVGTKSKMPPVPPTWIMETSPGNFQYGYAFSEQPDRLSFAQAITAIARAGYTDPGACNPVRNFRLPGSVNLKPSADGFVSRLVEFTPGREYTLADTVGFVKDLPHQLVDAFRSTLEEVSGADLIVHVVDGSHPDPMEQIRAVREVINEIGGGEIAEIIAINKVDIADPEVVMNLLRTEKNAYAFSVRTGFGIEGLLHAIEKSLPHPQVEVDVVIAYDRGDLVSAIHEHGEIISETYEESGTRIHARVDAGLAQAINEAVKSSLSGE
jgi:GTP-binding protein HflX